MSSGKRLNQKLDALWTLDWAAFRAAVQTAFKRDVPLRERDDWQELLQERRLEHEHLTAEIIRLETALNLDVYQLFALTADEIALIERETKYGYGGGVRGPGT